MRLQQYYSDIESDNESDNESNNNESDNNESENETDNESDDPMDVDGRDESSGTGPPNSHTQWTANDNPTSFLDVRDSQLFEPLCKNAKIKFVVDSLLLCNSV